MSQLKSIFTNADDSEINTNWDQLDHLKPENGLKQYHSSEETSFFSAILHWLLGHTNFKSNSSSLLLRYLKRTLKRKKLIKPKRN